MNIDKVFIEWHNYPNMACYNDVSCNSTKKVIELTGCVWKGKIKKKITWLRLLVYNVFNSKAWFQLNHSCALIFGQLCKDVLMTDWLF